MRPNVVDMLRQRGIQPSAQRVAVAQYVLFTEEHPSADRVWARVRGRLPMISRATVYNTLNLFAKKGLVRDLHLSADSVVFDANTGAHHHFIDEATGRIYDIPWETIAMRKLPRVEGFEIHDYQVVMRGRKAPDRERTRDRTMARQSAVSVPRDDARAAGARSAGKSRARTRPVKSSKATRRPERNARKGER